MRTTKHKDLDSVLHWFDSPAEFARECGKIPADKQDCNRSWTGETWEQAVQGAIRGRTEHVKLAESMLEKFNAEIEAPKTTWVRQVAGAYPSVPDAIMGHPDSMRRRIQAVDPVTPLRILIDTTSSGGIDHDDLLKRGITYLALVMVLETVRPLELYWSCGLGGGAHQSSSSIIRLSSSPLNLSIVCNALTSQGMTRGMGYSYVQGMDGSGGGWQWGLHPDSASSRKEWRRNMRKITGFERKDLIVPPIHMYDPALDDPVAFLHRTVNEYTNPEVQEAMMLNLSDDDE
jgi:hypothetical protein